MFSTVIRYFHSSTLLLMSISKLEQYQQEAYEVHSRFTKCTSYPGSIKAATPGDTMCYLYEPISILHNNERHYWRAVVDDPAIEYLIPLRIRFKTQVWVTTGWEMRMQVVQVMAKKEWTIKELIRQICIENTSPYLCTEPFTLAIGGKKLDDNKLISEYEISEHTPIDSISEKDEISHHKSEQLKDWNVDEITEEDLQISPYKEMGMQPTINLSPRWEGKPRGFYGRNNYSGMKQSS